MKFPQAPLRVAMTAASLDRAGAEKQFVYMARALHEAGVDVRVFYYGAGGFYERVLGSIGVPVIDVSSPGRAFQILWKLGRALRAFRPHVVMAGQFGDAIHAGIAGRFSGAMTIVGVRNSGFWELNEYRRRFRLMVRLPHALVANSYVARENLASLGVNPQRIKVLPNVIDLHDFDRQSDQEIPFPIGAGPIVVASVGRLHRDKRFDRVVDALALVRNTAVIGIIVGKDQGMKAVLAEQAQSAGLLPDRLVFLGESGNVPAVLKKSHLLVLSSDFEGFPNVIIEAMSAGLPVVTTPAGDSSRVVENGRTGFVVNFDDPKAMAERILELARSPELRRQMGDAGRKRVEEHYDSPQLLKQLLQIFREVATQQKRKALLSVLDQFPSPSTSKSAAPLGAPQEC